MACEQFRETNFRRDTLERIQRINTILEDYPNQRLTARQVYYQFVARGWLENTPRNYQNLTTCLTDARYAGIVDWDAIEDRGREPDVPGEWDSVEEIVEAAIRSFRLPRWAGQEHYVELWVEKQALAGVLAPIARRYHVTLMINKGYSSSSAMKASSERMIEHSDRAPIVFYLGDHDPSGEDMVRDIEDRLVEFGVRDLDVQKVALTMEQIRRFNPPPNPAKLTDSRARAYIERYGNSSWELDALPPRELNRLVERAIENVLDRPMMDEIIAREEQQKKTLRAAMKKMTK